MFGAYAAFYARNSYIRWENHKHCEEKSLRSASCYLHACPKKKQWAFYCVRDDDADHLDSWPLCWNKNDKNIYAFEYFSNDPIT